MGFFSKLFGKKEDNSVIIQQNQNKKTEKTTNESLFKVTTNVETQRNDFEIPQFQGEYAKTIFLYANNKPSSVKKDDSYQRYLLYECGIKSPSEYHRNLIAEGYFELTSTVEFLNEFKVAELKEILSQYGLQVAGKKENLIERIIENISEEEIKKLSSEESYSISSKGKEFLETHDDYVKIHQHKNWGIDWQEFDVNKQAGFSFFDVVWGILNKRVVSANNCGRNEYLCMYQLLVEEGKRERAIEMLLRVLYIDFSGINMQQSIDLYKTGVYTLAELKDCSDIVIMVAPGLVNDVNKYADVYKDEMVEKIYQWQLPEQVCSKELFFDIIHGVFSGLYDVEQIEKRLKVEYNRVISEKIKGC